MGIGESRTAVERGVGGCRGLVLWSEAAALAVFGADNSQERGGGTGRRGTCDAARASRSRSGARPDVETIVGSRRDVRRRS